jgi:hypothetical protein
VINRRSKWIKTIFATCVLAGAFAVVANAEPGAHSKLFSTDGGGASGMIEISPTAHDVVGPGTYDVQGTWNVHGLAADSGYRLLRWADLNPDGVCTGTTAATLPGNPTLTTSSGGAGAMHFEISRGAPFVDGVSFDVLFRVVDLAGATVLQSDCITATVK